ncbi:MAG: acyl-CoA desaturase [Verrucomicrobia bacterium]|nr:acyl-CoA desaturase [Verrucomicrobiota bacterium]
MKPFSSRVVIKELLSNDENMHLMHSSPLIFMHCLALGIPFTGISWPAVIVCMVTYSVRVFALTGGYHRYFSHRSYKTSRPFQFILGFLGASAAQLGPLWWASHHRHHHQHSDKPTDIHSPIQHGKFRSHIGWLFTRRATLANERRVRDWIKFPELVWLDRYHIVAPAALAVSMLGLGALCRKVFPSSSVTPMQMVMWGFVASTIMVYHVTFCINSATHLMGTKRFKTGDESRNSLLLGLLTFGEGWHNNHHRYPASVRQGFYAREIDITWYVLKVLEKLGLVWDMHSPPLAIYEEAARGIQD